MSDQNKDSLENFFKEGAQNYIIEFREGDWKRMEALLDSEMPVAFSFSAFLKKIWPLVALLLVIPLGWYSIDRISGNETQEASLVFSEEYMESKPPGSDDHIMETQISPDQSAVSKSQPLSETFSKDTERKEILEPGFSSSKKEVAATSFESENKDNVINRNPQNKEVGESGLLTGYAASGGKEVETVNSESFVYRVPGMLIPLFPGSAYSNPDDPGMIKPQPVIEDQGKSGQKVSFWLGAGFSPDFSTVGLGNFVSPGIRWNFMAEAGFSRRIMINTGIIWVNNKYEAYGEDYHAPARYWKKGIAADEAYGECVMLDIPLNIRYNFLISGRHQLFISGGMSTYILLKEDYYFEYEVDDPELPEHWGTDKTSVYPFKIVNLSLGYQYQMGRKGALQVEPFIKIPTAGVGWGEVDLHTIGIYFMYKYRLGR